MVHTSPSKHICFPVMSYMYFPVMSYICIKNPLAVKKSLNNEQGFTSVILIIIIDLTTNNYNKNNRIFN